MGVKTVTGRTNLFPRKNNKRGGDRTRGVLRKNDAEEAEVGNRNGGACYTQRIKPARRPVSGKETAEQNKAEQSWAIERELLSVGEARSGDLQPARNTITRRNGKKRDAKGSTKNQRPSLGANNKTVENGVQKITKAECASK